MAKNVKELVKYKGKGSGDNTVGKHMSDDASTGKKESKNSALASWIKDSKKK